MNRSASDPPSAPRPDSGCEYRLLSRPRRARKRANSEESQPRVVWVADNSSSGVDVLAMLSSRFRTTRAGTMREATRTVSREGCDALVVATSAFDVLGGGTLRSLVDACLHPPAAVVVILDSEPEVVPEGLFEQGATDVWDGMPHGEIARARVAGIVRTMSLAETRRTNEELRRKLESAEREKTEFFLTMSHELRTPLNAIVGFSELMLDGVGGLPSVEQKEFLGHVSRAGKHLVRLVDDVLGLSNLPLDGVRLQFGMLDLDGLLDDVVAETSQTAAVAGLTVIRSPASESLRLSCDGPRIRQVLAVLVVHAVGRAPRASRAICLGARLVSFGYVASMLAGTGRSLNDSEFEVFVEIGIEPDAQHVGLPRQPVAIGASESGETGERYYALGKTLEVVTRLVELHRGVVVVDMEGRVGLRTVVFVPYRIEGSR